MKTNIIKWDKSMAVRCLAKCEDRGENAEELWPVEEIPEDFMWEDFEKAISEALSEK